MRTRFSFPPQYTPPIHVTLRHPEALGNGFFSISLLLMRTSTGFSHSITVSAYTQISSPFFPCTTHLFVTFWVINPQSHYQMRTCALPSLFFLLHLRSCNTYMIFLLSTRVLRKGIDHKWYILLSDVRPTNVHSSWGHSTATSESSQAPTSRHQRRIQT